MDKAPDHPPQQPTSAEGRWRKAGMPADPGSSLGGRQLDVAAVIADRKPGQVPIGEPVTGNHIHNLVAASHPAVAENPYLADSVSVAGLFQLE
jgi:hypothetical protein